MHDIIKRNFKHKSMVQSHLDYCSFVWPPYKKGDIDALEKVQKQATKVLPELKK